MKRTYLCGLIATATIVSAAEPVPTVIARLKHPTAIVAGPADEMFVLDSGAGKLIRFKNDKPTDVVVGYPSAAVPAFDSYRLGPLSVAITPGDVMLIGDGGESADGLIRVFPWFKDSAFEREKPKDKIGPLIFSAPRKENWFVGLATAPEAIFAVCHNGKTFRGLARAEINGTKFGPLERWGEVAADDSFNPTAIVIHPEDGHVVVGRKDGAESSPDSRLTIYSRQSGKPLLDLNAGAIEISGLVYSPKTGLLYAIDVGWKRPEEGGLFRLDGAANEEGQAIRTTRIATLDRPTGLAFAEDGTLWVTLLGKKDEERTGSLLRFKPGL